MIWTTDKILIWGFIRRDGVDGLGPLQQHLVLLESDSRDISLMYKHNGVGGGGWKP